MPPLRWATPRPWAQACLAAPLELLNDHAHLERKAASNALDLLGRWPQRVDVTAAPPAADRWVQVLTHIARDELAHLDQVLGLLHRRGGHMARAHENPYASALHAHARRATGTRGLHDRLLVCALIELRSCERFGLLSEAARDDDLRALYSGLERSERGHYKAFLELAALLPGEGCHTEARFEAWLDIEAGCMAAQTPGPRMHAGGARA